jgi:pSer/pThr/pTyr-binding forkhead associated (FHA) protein
MAPQESKTTGVARMDARLTIVGGPASGQTIPVVGGKLIIGREEDCHLQPPSEFVSRHHCVLLLDEYTLRIRDLGSKNGTFVNSRRIGPGETILRDGDLVSVGEFLCQIHLTSETTGVTSEVSAAQPAALPWALERTRSIEGETVEAEGSSVAAPAPPPPAGAP